MTPIERVSAQSQALAVLGLAGQPSKSMIRDAFRKLAKEKHPDLGTCSQEEFIQISNAYAFLNGASNDFESTARSSRVSSRRPSVTVTETDFTIETIDLCAELFEDAPRANARHVATKQIRKGRILVYIVPDKAVIGLNQVAVPTGDLVDSRSIKPQMIEVWSGDMSSSVYDVPPQQCAKLFPGARSVQIRFGTPVKN